VKRSVRPRGCPHVRHLEALDSDSRELIRQIASIVNEHGRTQSEAATRCSVTQPRMNDLLRGRVSRFSIDALVNIATAIGGTVRIEHECSWPLRR